MPQDLGLPGGFGTSAFADAFTQMLAEREAARIRAQQLELQRMGQVSSERRADAQDRRAEAQDRREQQDLEFRTSEETRKTAVDAAKAAAVAQSDRQFDIDLQATDLPEQAKQIIRLSRKSGDRPSPEVLSLAAGLKTTKAAAPVHLQEPTGVTDRKGAPVLFDPTGGETGTQFYYSQSRKPLGENEVIVKVNQPDPLVEALRRRELANDPEAAKATARADNSFKEADRKIGDMRKTLADRAERYNRLIDTVNEGTPQADRLVAPELITVIAGGAGSGVRINEAEIQNVTGGRSGWESIKAAVNHWQADPTKALSITPVQRGQIRQLLAKIGQRTQAQLDVLDNASQALVDHQGDVEKHRQIITDTRRSLDTVMGATGTNAGVPAQLPPLDQRVAGKTRARMNGSWVIWTKKPNGQVGWATDPNQQ